MVRDRIQIRLWLVLKWKPRINVLSHFFDQLKKHDFDSTNGVWWVWDVFGQQLFFIYLFFKLVMLLIDRDYTLKL